MIMLRSDLMVDRQTALRIARRSPRCIPALMIRSSRNCTIPYNMVAAGKIRTTRLIIKLSWQSKRVVNVFICRMEVFDHLKPLPSVVRRIHFFIIFDWYVKRCYVKTSQQHTYSSTNNQNKSKQCINPIPVQRAYYCSESTNHTR